VQFGNNRKLNSIYFTNERIGDADHAIRGHWRGVADGAALGSAASVNGADADGAVRPQPMWVMKA
jgi:hypothetical protein